MLHLFYFTYGPDKHYPFRDGWTLIIAPSESAAAEIFRIYHPNREGSDCLNCAWVYRADEFEQSEAFKKGNFGGYYHEIIGPYPADEINRVQKFQIKKEY